MQSCDNESLVISGIGITTAVGQGKAQFLEALFEGRHAFAVMRRPGRQCDSAFLGAELQAVDLPTEIASCHRRGLTLSGQAALAAVHEAWVEARLRTVEPERIGLYIGGSNVQQRELERVRNDFRDRSEFLSPTYGVSFLDNDLCGLCTEQFGITGPAHTVGAASASGNVAAIHALQAVRSGAVDVCIAVGALMDISHWECRAWRNMGAMGSDRFANEPELACRPFDVSSDGFIYGESCGAIVIERASHALRRGVPPYVRLSGWATTMDAKRGPTPSLEGEMAVIKQALRAAAITPDAIDYINPHGSGSPIGDATELRAILECELGHARINATKSVTGHGISAAGIVELIATALQMREGRLHGTRNLQQPVEPSLNWVTGPGEPQVTRQAISLSFGFGGVNTAICLASCGEPKGGAWT
jgi:malonyl-ACP decarboxylase